ncbi:MAG: PA14 domain-containing protein [Tunicatimonas sp.]
MKLFTLASKYCILLATITLLSCFNYAFAQISSAYVPSGSTNRLVVKLSSSTTLSNSAGWYLVGGGAEVKRLISGSGSSTLTFELTDYVLPNDRFALYYYQELGSALSKGKKVRSTEAMSVSTSGISAYRGSRKVYYVSRSGSSGNSGTSSSKPTSFSQAISKAGAGDYILLRKGETYTSPLNIKSKKGTESRPITIGTYGSGSKPIITGSTTPIEIRDSHYIHVVGVESKPSSGSRVAGVRILGTSRYCTVRSLTVVGPKKHSDGTGIGSGISYSSADGKGRFPYHSTVMHSTVSRFKDGIYGYRIKGGGKIRFNKVSYCAVDGIRAFDGDTDGIIIGHNEITKFSDDGVDLFNGSEVIVEYNEIHDPISPRSGGANNGIKGGGASGSTASRDIIIRYNTVYNIYRRRGSPNGITTNGATSGEIYGNLCYNIDDNAIEITASKTNKSWKVYNNTAISSKGSALIVAPKNPSVSAYNNILKGAISDVRVNGSSRVVGKNNILVNNRKAGNYSGQKDFSSNTSSLFRDQGKKDFRLKESSPAINKGTYVNDYEKDILGRRISSSHDIGCYEFRNQSDPTPSPKPEPEPEPEPKPEPKPDPKPAPDPKPTPSPKPKPTPPTSAEPGLRYRHYHGKWRALPNFASQSVVRQGEVTNFSLSPRTRNEYFGMVYDGRIKIDKAGKYTFYTTADDGVKLFINGKLVVSDDGIHAARERSGTITLGTGLHAIRVEYFDRTYDEVLEVRYKGNGVSKQRIPNSKLFLPSSSNQRTSATAQIKKAAEDTNALLSGEIVTYPNPIRRSFTVVLPTQMSYAHFKLINLTGATVWQKEMHNIGTQTTIATTGANIAPGYYLLVISNRNEVVYTNKVLKK